MDIQGLVVQNRHLQIALHRAAVDNVTLTDMLYKECAKRAKMDPDVLEVFTSAPYLPVPKEQWEEMGPFAPAIDPMFVDENLKDIWRGSTKTRLIYVIGEVLVSKKISIPLYASELQVRECVFPASVIEECARSCRVLKELGINELPAMFTNMRRETVLLVNTLTTYKPYPYKCVLCFGRIGHGAAILGGCMFHKYHPECLATIMQLGVVGLSCKTAEKSCYYACGRTKSGVMRLMVHP